MIIILFLRFLLLMKYILNSVLILITCDPVSYAILGIKLCPSCTSAEWKAMWEKIKVKSNVVPLYITKDEGKQMECARKELFPELNVQSDSYHGVAHKLGLWHKRLEKIAYKKIEVEYKKEELLLESKTETTSLKRKLEYEDARSECIIALDILEDFEFIYYNLLSCFECIDSNGQLKDKEQITEKFEATLELGIECIKEKTIVKRLKSICKIQKRLFYFYNIARNILKKLKTETDSFVLELISLYWQIHKRYIKTKNNRTRQKIKLYKNTILADIKELTGGNFEKTIKELNNIIQSSSAIECINLHVLFTVNYTCKAWTLYA